MWTKLKRVRSQIGHGAVYSIVQEFLTYSKNNPSSGYDKSANSVFGDVRFLSRRLRATITPEKDLCDSLAIVVALDSFHEDFAPAIAALNQGGEKTMDEIQSALSCKTSK